MRCKMDRKKELKRQYLQTFIEPGVLKIENKHNGKMLIYAAKNIKAAMNRIQSELRMGCNRLPIELLKDFQKYGSEGFTFDFLEVITQNKDPFFDYDWKLREIEKKWLDKYKPYGERGYN